MRSNATSWLCGLFTAAACGLATAQNAAAPVPAYSTGFAAMEKLAGELQRQLAPKNREIVSAQPVVLEASPIPYTRLNESGEPARPSRGLAVSSGFVDLVNYFSHARAIDKIERGYLQRYIAQLGQEVGSGAVPAPPGLNNPRYWADDVMNEQISNFSQISAVMIGSKLAHHYLGHYRRYAGQLVDQGGHLVPINLMLTASEYEDAIKAGVRNALDCGFGVEGIKSLIDAIEKMPQKPVWTADIFPAKVKASKLKRDLEKQEKIFFAGGQ
jgi:hypothetical protein